MSKRPSHPQIRPGSGDSDLEEFNVPLNPYYDDAEPQGVIDNILSGKINSLRAYLQLLGWSELVTQLEGMTPLRGNAVEALDLVQSVVVPEARRLASISNIDHTLLTSEGHFQRS